MHVLTYVHVYTHLQISVYLCGLFSSMYICMRMYIYIYIYILMHVYVYVCK